MRIRSLLGMIVFLTVIACVPVGQEQTSKVSDFQEIKTTFDETKFMTKLSHYCGECHSLGEYRFINENLTNQQNIEFLLKTKTKLTQKVWAASIVEVLSWPGDSIPTNLKRVDSKRRFMPFGRKKYSFNKERIDGVELRTEMISFLSRRIDEKRMNQEGDAK
jgi:hypothetical protein